MGRISYTSEIVLLLKKKLESMFYSKPKLYPVEKYLYIFDPHLL